MIKTNKEYNKLVKQILTKLDKIKYPSHLNTIENRQILNNSVKKFHEIKNNISKEISNDENLVEKIKEHRTKLDVILFPYIDNKRKFENGISYGEDKDIFEFKRYHFDDTWDHNKKKYI